VIDLHAHIIPALDDGPSDMAETIDLCRIAVENGIETIVATPHMYNGLFTVSKTDVLEGVERVREALAEQNIPLQVLPGAEAHISRDLPDLLKRREALTIADGGKYVLLELPENIVPAGLDEFLFSLRLMGITVILAHPERNYDFQLNPERLHKIVSAGHVVQLTAFSVTGEFGKQAQSCAEKILKAGLCQVVASDCHTRFRPPVLAEAREVVEDLLGRERAEQMFLNNPREILAGMPLEAPVSPLATKADQTGDKANHWFRRLWK